MSTSSSLVFVVFSPFSSSASFSSSIIGVVVVVIEEEEKEISIGSVSLLTPSMECSRI